MAAARISAMLTSSTGNTTMPQKSLSLPVSQLGCWNLAMLSLYQSSRVASITSGWSMRLAAARGMVWLLLHDIEVQLHEQWVLFGMHCRGIDQRGKRAGQEDVEGSDVRAALDHDARRAG